MKIFKSDQQREIDRFTIENEPIASINLMERAAIQCSNWLFKKYDRNRTFKIFTGSGNNGGDGLAIARLLKAKDFKVEVFLVKGGNKLSPDAAQNLEWLTLNSTVPIIEINSSDQFPQIYKDDIIIDALFGSGLTRQPDGIFAETIEYLNHCPGAKIAIDIPSGLSGENNTNESIGFNAHHTLTFQFPFLSFFFAENSNFVGQWHLLDIGLHPNIIHQLQTDWYLTGLENIVIKKRPEFGNKGTFGHSLIFAGSTGMAGAAVLTSKACLRSGCGLVTVHVPYSLSNIIHSSFPEALVSNDEEKSFITSIPDISKFSAIGIGPGIGKDKKTQSLLIELIKKSEKPLVIDADALNIFALNKEWIKNIPKNSILTPHPGEFDRLFGASENNFERLIKQQYMSKELGVVIILKGRYTCISFPDGSCHFNPTGNAGMATAGAGDVLTGIIVSLLSQGYEPQRAALTGVFLHGMAGDLAVEDLGQEALIASNIIQYIAKAFLKIKYSKNEDN